MRAEEAAIKLHRERGHVVVGYTDALESPVKLGDYLRAFCGGPLINHRLVVEEETSRLDWDEQIRHIFGAVSTPLNLPPAERQRFYRCRLELARA